MLEATVDQLGANLDVLARSLGKLATVHTSPLLLIHPPTSREGYVEQVRKQIDELETLLAMIHRMETKVVALRTSLFRQQRRAAFALAPISALPEAVLRGTFSFVAGTTTISPFYSQPVTSSRNLSMVCQTRRQVALNQRALWSIFRMPFHNPAIEKFLKLSKDADLELSILDCPKPFTNQHTANSLRGRLRILNVECSGPTDAVFSRYFHTPDEGYTFSKLESLQLLGTGLSELEHDLSMISFPKLHHLSLDSMMLQQGIDAEQLISLEISYPKTEQFVDHLRDLLDGCPRMQSLAISGVQVDDSQTPTQNIPANLPDLKMLEVRATFLSGLADILECLNAPHLEALIIKDVFASEAYDFANDEVANNEEFNDQLSLPPATEGAFVRWQIRQTVCHSVV